VAEEPLEPHEPEVCIAVPKYSALADELVVFASAALALPLIVKLPAIVATAPNVLFPDPDNVKLLKRM